MVPSISEDDQEKKIYTTWPDMIKHWPKTSLLILSNEFCERFAYYGLRAVLVIYLINILNYTEDQASIMYQLFNILCFITPVFGSILADGYIGKYWTIFSVSLIYAAGEIILSIAATEKQDSSTHPGMDLAGLAIIAIGTGGIKPCVSAFGGDQFDQKQEKMISTFFSVFYFTINAGSTISSFITPIFRTQPCLGQDTCFPLAFGVPAVLMIVATGIFMAGSFWYKKPPPKENIFGEVSRVIGRAVVNKTKSKEKKEHWLDYYLAGHDCETDPKCLALQKQLGKPNACHKKALVEDIKSLLRVLVMFLPVPIFWSLYDQQGSIWTIQALQMDTRLSDSVNLLPDQMATVNAVLILILIPFFQVVVYPLVGMVFKLTPLRKMVAGGLVASVAFVICGIVQINIQNSIADLPGDGEAFVSVWNQLDGCNVTATYNGDKRAPLGYDQALTEVKLSGTTSSSTFHLFYQHTGKLPKTIPSWSDSIQLDFLGPRCGSYPVNSVQKYGNRLKYNVRVQSRLMYTVAVTPNGIFETDVKTDKPTDGSGEFSIGFVTALNQKFDQNLAVCRVYSPGEKHYDANNPCNPRRPTDFYAWETNYNDNTDDRTGYPMYYPQNINVNATAYKFKPVKPGTWAIYYMYILPKSWNYQSFKAEDVTHHINYTGVQFTINSQGGVFLTTLTGDYADPVAHQWQLVSPNTVSILWQIPQYVIITAAEVLFSVTGLEFAYSQSPASMKSLVQALWLLTSAIGDSIMVIITASQLFKNMVVQFFVYAGIMAVVMAIFAFMAMFYYEYRTEDVEENEDNQSLDDTEDGRSTNKSVSSLVVGNFNKGFAEDADEMSDDGSDTRL